MITALQNQIPSLQSSLGVKESEITRLGAEVELITAENVALASENAALKETIDADEESQPPTYLYNVEIKGDWVIDDYQEINDAFLNLDASIFIVGDGKLVIRNSYINVIMDYNFEHTINLGDEVSDESPVLELYNVTFSTEQCFVDYP